MNTNNTEHKNEIKELNDKLDKITNELSKLSFTVSSSINLFNNNLESIKALLLNSNSNSKSIDETITLYSLSKDPLINDLELSDDMFILRTCRSNIKSMKSLISHDNQIVTVHKEYIVSNPHNISSKIYTILMDEYSNDKKTKDQDSLISDKNDRMYIDTYYGHIIVKTADLERLINIYDHILRTVDSKSICISSKSYILNRVINKGKRGRKPKNQVKVEN